VQAAAQALRAALWRRRQDLLRVRAFATVPVARRVLFSSWARQRRCFQRPLEPHAQAESALTIRQRDQFLNKHHKFCCLTMRFPKILHSC